MTTVAQARAALATAVSASDREIAPPAKYVFSGGSDLTPLGGGGVEWGFRVTCAVEYAGDGATASIYLADLVAATLTIIRGLAGWRIVSVGPDSTRLIAGGEQFAADINTSFRVHI